jgi:DNA (cytosine-5)-methyltransferase 1
MLRLVAEVRPTWVLCENVAALERMALGMVVSDLEACGFEVGTFEIPACAVGHDHRRTRLWICGHADRDGEPRLSVDGEMAGLPGPGDDAGGLGAEDGIPSRIQRMRMLGNAVVPAIPEAIGRAILEAEDAGSDL